MGPVMVLPIQIVFDKDNWQEVAFLRQQLLSCHLINENDPDLYLAKDFVNVHSLYPQLTQNPLPNLHHLPNSPEESDGDHQDNFNQINLRNNEISNVDKPSWLNTDDEIIVKDDLDLTNNVNNVNRIKIKFNDQYETDPKQIDKNNNDLNYLDYPIDNTNKMMEGYEKLSNSLNLEDGSALNRPLVERRRYTRDITPEYLTSHPSHTTTTVSVPQIIEIDSEEVKESTRNTSVPRKSNLESNLPSPRYYKKLLNLRLARNVTTVDSTENRALNEEYIRVLEHQIRDLRQRIRSCRNCLPSRKKRLGSCGVGEGWRQHRRLEKIRKKGKKQRRERHKKENDANQMAESDQNDATTREEHIPNISPHEARQNRRQSVDFRRGFNQKIVRMDEALQQFSETQSAFCKELRNNLGASLEKRGMELGALSEQVAALVRTSTKQVSMLEIINSDQVYSSQQHMEKNLANLLTLKESQVRFIRNFHKKIMLPGLVNLNALLSSHASTVTSMGMSVITQAEMLEDAFITHSTRQADSLQKLTEEADMMSNTIANLRTRGQDLSSRLQDNADAFVREIQNRVNNVVKELVVIRVQSQTFANISDASLSNITSTLNATEAAVGSFSSKAHSTLSDNKAKSVSFAKQFTKDVNALSTRVESGVSATLSTNHQALSQVEESELETRRFVNSASTAWTELFLSQENELRVDTDKLTNNLQAHTHHTQNILTGLNNAAETHELLLEEQRSDFSRFVGKRQDALDSQCMAISDWSGLMSSELRRRDEDLHRFLSDNLHYSLAPLPYPEDADEYLVSRLPDGTFLYHTPMDAPNPKKPESVYPVMPKPSSYISHPSHKTTDTNNNPSELFGETNKKPSELFNNNPSKLLDETNNNLSIKSTSSKQYSPEAVADPHFEVPAMPIGFESPESSEDQLPVPENENILEREKEVMNLPPEVTQSSPEDERVEESSSFSSSPPKSGISSSGNDVRPDLTAMGAETVLASTSQSDYLQSKLESGEPYSVPREGEDPMIHGDEEENSGVDKEEIYKNEKNVTESNIEDSTSNNITIDLMEPNKTSYSIHGFSDSENEDDEGFIKLRTILDAAERSIINFQNDIGATEVFEALKNNNSTDGSATTSWLRPNGRFDEGFWKDWGSNSRVPNSDMMTPKTTNVWTPTYPVTDKPLRHRHWRTRRKMRKFSAADQGSSNRSVNNVFKHYGKF